MKLGLCTIAFRDRPLEEVISIADDYGFDGIEIWGQEPHMPATYDSEYIERVRKLIEGRDLEVSAYGSYVNPLLDKHPFSRFSVNKKSNDFGHVHVGRVHLLLTK